MTTRIPEIIRYSQNAIELDVSSYFHKLEMNERHLFRLGYHQKKCHLWLADK